MLGGMRDGDDGDDVRIVWELGDGQARWEFGDATTPGTADLLLAAAHLGQTHGAARVSTVQEFGPSARTVIVKADLALQNGILGKSLHISNVDQGPLLLCASSLQTGNEKANTALMEVREVLMRFPPSSTSSI